MTLIKYTSNIDIKFWDKEKNIADRENIYELKIFGFSIWKETYSSKEDITTDINEKKKIGFVNE